MPAVRDELAATLEETLRLQQRLVDDVRDEGVDVADLVAQVSVLERLDDRRDQLIGQLRRTASAGMRPARTSPPVREVLLETLADFRWPQNAGFLEEYLLARHQLQLDSRAFAPLRRDERNAWDRAPGAREAYIAPALKPDGSANPRWITRSDWEMGRRIVATCEQSACSTYTRFTSSPGGQDRQKPATSAPAVPSMRYLRSMRRTSSTPSHRRPPHPTTSSGHGGRISASAPALSSGRSAGMTSWTASRSPASLLACPTVSASGAGTQAPRPEAAAPSAHNNIGLRRCELDLGAQLQEQRLARIFHPPATRPLGITERIVELEVRLRETLRISSRAPSREGLDKPPRQPRSLRKKATTNRAAGPA